MRVVRIVIENFQCYAGEHVVEFHDAPVTVVVGPNSAGKTALLESLAWCLYGADATRRGKSEDDLVHDGAARARVRVEFSDGSWVERSRARRGKRTLEVFDARTSTRTDDRSAPDAVVRLVGCDRERFASSVHVAQRSVDGLARARSSERRSILLGQLDDGSWERLVQRVEESARAASETVVTVRARLDEVELAVVECRDESEIVADLEIAQDARARLARVEEKARTAERQARAVRDVEHARETLRVATAAVPLTLPDLDTVREREWQVRASLTEVTRLAIDGFDGTCPVSRTPCPAVAEVQRVVAASTERRLVAEDEHSRAVADLRAAEGVHAEAVRLQRVRDRAVGDWNRVVAQLREYVDVHVDGHNEDSCDDAVSLNVVAQQVPSLERELAQAHASRVASARASALRLELESTQRGARAASLLLRAVRAVPGPVAVARDAVEAGANYLLEGAGATVRLEWEAEAGEGGGRCASCSHRYRGAAKACPKCGSGRSRGRMDSVEVWVRGPSGREEPIESCGGLGDLACLALTLSAAHVGGSTRLATRLVDEACVHLKAERLAHLNDLLARVSDVGVEQVILVTNRDATRERWGRVIEVRRSDASSYLVQS